MGRIILGLFITTKLFAQSDSLDTSVHLSKLIYGVSHKVYNEGLKDFFIIENQCLGTIPIVGQPYDSCEVQGYVIYNLTRDSVAVRTFGICGLNQQLSKKLSLDLLNFFAANRQKIRLEGLKHENIGSHPCVISFYEFRDKRLWTESNYMYLGIPTKDIYGQSKERPLTYKLLTGLMTELKNINGR